MTRLILRGGLIFLALLGASALLQSFFQLPFGERDYFDAHGFFLLFCLAVAPRLSLLFSSIPFGGVTWWLGFFFAPRLLIAMLATVAYFKTNPLLVVMSWMVALSGEIWEKTTLRRSSFHIYRKNASRNEIEVESVVID